MPDFVATLAAAALFCGGVLILNGLTRLALHLHLAPADLAENGLLQYGLALGLAGLFWRLAARDPI
ncbi:hypothetical protein [Methylobacterium sp.]|jgi:hypothetical protein|uniref:hypothetical protein n=1 Tax=Methylobacterium sp. TaxID=409 RepID=UPI0025CEEAEE|nr:hypothetical protein [Methylobacterium sp.]MBY0257952.1 hypothetical protein [Methylobacterium sp.]